MGRRLSHAGPEGRQRTAAPFCCSLRENGLMVHGRVGNPSALGLGENQAPAQAGKFTVAGTAAAADNRLHGLKSNVVVEHKVRVVVFRDDFGVEGLGDALLFGSADVAATQKVRLLRRSKVMHLYLRSRRKLSSSSSK
jgi:hypothetical protein